MVLARNQNLKDIQLQSVLRGHKRENSGYTQDISIEGILETDTPTIDLILSDNIETAKSQIEAWSCISRITTSNSKVTVYCYDSSPTIEIPIQIICIR